MRREILAEGEYYHVYNRGVEKRYIYRSLRDYERFLFTLFACNDRRPALNTRHQYRGLTSVHEVERSVQKQGVRQALTDILCFCLMPNHFHLLVRQRDQDGLSVFMQKVGTAYTMYFNTKYERDGALFQGTYKAIRIPSDRYLLQLTRYIHLNPLDLTQPHWRTRTRSGSAGDAHGLLLRYLWSSYADYVGEERYSFLLNGTLVRSVVGPAGKDYRDFVEKWRGRELHRIVPLVIE